MRVFLIDGSGYIFRAFYAVHHLSTKEGFPTNALFGFVKMLLKLLTLAESEHTVVVFDAGRKTFRNDLYEAYKANRAECPEDLVPQMPYFRELSRALGLPVLELPGYEADDIIGTLSERLSKSEDNEIVIVSGDKDLMQLVTDRVQIWDTMKDKHYGPGEVKEKFGVGPDKVLEFLALTGDTSDNIPGLQGVGPKTAADLLNIFGNIDSLIEAPQKLLEEPRIRSRKKIAEQLELNADALRLSRELVAIKLDTPVMLDSESGQREISSLSDGELLSLLTRRDPDEEELAKLVEKFEFHSLLKDLNISAKKVRGEETATYKLILKAEFPEWLEKFQKITSFAFDFETDSLDVKEARPVGLAICWSKDESYYIPFLHTERVDEQLSFSDFLKAAGSHFSNPKIRKIGHNLKFDIGVSEENGMRVEGELFDTMMAAHLLNPEVRANSLEDTASSYLKLYASSYSDVVEEGENFTSVPLANALSYAAEDAHYAFLLSEVLGAKLEDEGLAKVMHDIEAPLIPVLSRLERRGIALDTELLSKLSLEYEKLLEIMVVKIFKAAGREFNMNSPKQLSEILFTELGIATKGVKKTKTGFSTDSSVLELLRERHELPALILDYRAIFKLKSTYVDALPKQISQKTGRLHTRLHQTGTATGRLSSSDPNLQNIPIQTEEGRRIRHAFIAPKGRVLISADYSQIELRLLAHLSGDKNLIQGFKDNHDIHSMTARDIFGLRESEEVSSEERRAGKTINFGIVYGMSGFRLAKELGIPYGEAEQYIKDYFSRYPKVRELFDHYEKEATEKGEVRTLFGRKRSIADIDTSSRDRGFAMRVAINAPIQGSAAEIVKLSMLKVDRKLETFEGNPSLLLQIHDELVVECDMESVDSVKDIVQKEMQEVYTLSVPLKVDIGHGSNWDAAHS